MPALIVVALIALACFMWAMCKLTFALLKLMVLAGIALVALVVVGVQALLQARRST